MITWCINLFNHCNNHQKSQISPPSGCMLAIWYLHQLDVSGQGQLAFCIQANSRLRKSGIPLLEWHKMDGSPTSCIADYLHWLGLICEATSTSHYLRLLGLYVVPHHLVLELGLARLTLPLLKWALAIEWGVSNVGRMEIQYPTSVDYQHWLGLICGATSTSH